jgi:hypothetical protein
MSKVIEFVKQHKVAVAVGTAAVVGLLLLRKSSNTTAAGGTSQGDSLQIAQLQSAQNLQQAQIQAQQNVAVIGAQTQVDQTNAQLQGQQDTLAAELASQFNTNGTQAALIAEQTAAQQKLVTMYGPTALATATKGGAQNSATGLNELALLLGEEGNTGSYNASLFGQSAQLSNNNTALLLGLEKLGGQAAGAIL